MAYVATRGGERAITQSERLFRAEMGEIDATRVEEIKNAMPYLIDRVMGEASLYDVDLAALALAQPGGGLYEAVLLLRATRGLPLRLRRPPFAHRRFLHHRLPCGVRAPLPRGFPRGVRRSSAPRGRRPAEGRALGEALLASTKERGEHAHVVDAIRDVLAARIVSGRSQNPYSSVCK